jgi:hypothetical protein
MNDFKRTLYTNWTWRRAFGGLIGVFVAVQAIILKDVLLGLISAYFLYQIVTNTGCFGSADCFIPLSNQKPPHRITFNENKNKT